MMSLDEIKAFYPPMLQNRGEFILREYLQYKILEIIFQSKYANKFSFLGGTCLRIVHNNQRFSEDLDFDNFNLSEEDFTSVSNTIQKELELQGFQIEIRNVFKGAFHCYIKFPGLLFATGLSGHKTAKILINLDTEPQNFSFESENVFLNKFDVFTSIKTTPIDILLSQKMVAMTNRKRPKGRDLFDIVFLLGKTKPNYDFLNFRLGISDKEQLKEHLLRVCQTFDFQKLSDDVKVFLFQPSDVKRVLYFEEYVKTVEF